MTDLLVGTLGGLWLAEAGREPRLLLDQPVRGITWSDSEVYLATSRGQGRVVAWGEDCVIMEPVHDVHQILWSGGRLYATNTQANRLDVWDGEEVSPVQWLADPPPDEHVNSVWRDGERFYVCEHRMGVVPARIRIFDRGFEELDLVDLVELPDAQTGIHNVYVENDQLVTLAGNKAVCIDLRNHFVDTFQITGAGAYLRGLARVGHKFFIGQSPVSAHDSRQEGDGVVLETTCNFGVVAETCLPDAAQVYEVRALEGDLAHNGIPCPRVWE